MKVFGDMSLAGLSSLALGDAPDEQSAGLAAKALDTDGDGRNDLFLLDEDGDGTVDGVVRGLDQNGDGLNDTYITYNEDGSIRSIGRVSETGELDVVYEEPGIFDKLLAELGLIDLESPEEALFTSFDDPYFADTYGTWAEDLPEDLPETFVVQPSDVTDLTESEYLEISDGASVVDEDAAPDGEAAAVERTESTILEVGDSGDGWLYADVDVDGDGIADRRDSLQRTVGGWEGDVDKDGLKETVAFDADEDGRVDSVDTSGKGDWAGSTQAWEVVHQPTDIVDDGLFEGDGSAESGAAVDADLDSDAGATADADADIDTASVDDSSASADAGGSSESSVSSDPGPTDDTV